MRDFVADLYGEIELFRLGWSKEDLELIIERVAKDAEEAELAFYHARSQRERLKELLKAYRYIHQYRTGAPLEKWPHIIEAARRSTPRVVR